VLEHVLWFVPLRVLDFNLRQTHFRKAGRLAFEDTSPGTANVDRCNCFSKTWKLSKPIEIIGIASSQVVNSKQRNSKKGNSLPKSVFPYPEASLDYPDPPSMEGRMKALAGGCLRQTVHARATIIGYHMHRGLSSGKCEKGGRTFVEHSAVRGPGAPGGVKSFPVPRPGRCFREVGRGAPQRGPTSFMPSYRRIRRIIFSLTKAFGRCIKSNRPESRLALKRIAVARVFGGSSFP
jgi:hypothetical protein